MRLLVADVALLISHTLRRVSDWFDRQHTRLAGWDIDGPTGSIIDGLLEGK